MIKVTKIPDGTSETALLLFFENFRKSGGGSIEDLKYDPDTKSAVITFEDPEAVKRVIQKLPILFNGVQIGVEEFQPDVKFDYSGKAEAAMIKVTKIPDGTSETALLFFFENCRKSGGGSIEDLKYDPDTNSAVITFEDPEAVKRVIEKLPILFNGVQIGVEEFRPDIKVDDYSGEAEAAMIKVTKIPDGTSETALLLFFENFRKSGGGSIEDLKYDPDTKSAVITFEDPELIEQVLKKNHRINGTAIEVCRYVPPPPLKPVPVYSNKVLITNINEKTTKDGLENFLEAKTNITPVSIEYGELKGTVLITFEEDIDFEKLQLACKKRTLDKIHLEISRVPITNCVIVRNISERTSRDTLLFYFDNKKLSGVSGVMDVKMLNGFYVVYFEEPNAVDVVCNRRHRIDWKDVDVEIYYECLGQVENDDEPFNPPASLEISDLDHKKLQFFFQSPPNQRVLEKQLEAVYGKPIWPKKSKSYYLTVECTLTSDTKDCRRLARLWETKVKERLNKCLDRLHVCKHTTLPETFPLVLIEVKSLTISNPDAVAVIYDQNKYEIYLTGNEKAVKNMSKQMSDIIHKKNTEQGFKTGMDESDVSDLAMSQHYVDCQFCGGYSEFYCNACHQRMCGNCRDEHLRHPDNSQHEVCRYEDRKLTIPSIPCKLHPRQQLTLCCENCQQAICALCTTKGHAGHGFLDLEEVYTKKYKTRIEHIRKIRDDILPTSRLRLQESRNATLEIKGNLEMLKSNMKAQASQFKKLVDAILTENLQDLHSYETSAIEKLENQETVFDTYVTQMQAMLEEYKNSMLSENPVDFLSELNDTFNLKLEPIPEVPKINPGNFSNGKLSKEEIRKQFGVLTKPVNDET